MMRRGMCGQLPPTSPGVCLTRRSQHPVSCPLCLMCVPGVVRVSPHENQHTTSRICPCCLCLLVPSPPCSVSVRARSCWRRSARRRRGPCGGWWRSARGRRTRRRAHGALLLCAAVVLALHCGRPRIYWQWPPKRVASSSVKSRPIKLADTTRSHLCVLTTVQCSQQCAICVCLCLWELCVGME